VASGSIDSNNGVTLPDFITLDPEGPGALPTTVADWESWTRGFQDGLFDVNPELLTRASLYGNGSDTGASPESIGLPYFWALTFNNTPGDNSFAIYGDAEYTASCPASTYISEVGQWGRDYNTIQFSGSGIPCAP
jgi:hypothetical protein